MRIVIVGAGPAGITVAEEIRRHDRGVHVTLLSSEPHPPYSPPALADHFLTGRDDTLFWKGRDVCERLSLDFHPGATVARLDTHNRRLFLDDETSLLYDRLVIASGSRPHAPIAGSDLPGIANFKSLSAAAALVARARRGDARQAVVVGAGFIGVEVALLLADLGLSVTLLEAQDRVMPSMLDRDTARIVEAEIVRRRVTLRLRTKVRAFVGERVVTGVELEDGSELGGDIFVASTGVKPNVGWLAGSGLTAEWGVVVNDQLRTSDEHVWAAGDVAETRDRLTGERWVHAIFPNAVAQGRVVARNVLGIEAFYEGSESMNSLKHVGLPVMAVGAMAGEQELAYRAGAALRKIFLRDGRIVGFRLAGDVRSAGVYRWLMLKQVDVQGFGTNLVDPSFGVAAAVSPHVVL